MQRRAKQLAVLLAASLATITTNPRDAKSEDAEPRISSKKRTAAVPASKTSAPRTRTKSATEENKESKEMMYGVERQGKARDLVYKWQTAGRHYVVPLAFFSIHGYLEGVYGGESRGWNDPDPTQVGAPGQLLVPNTSDSAFQYDAAIFISTDTSAHTRSLLEIHLVSNPSGNGTAGPGGITLAMTEASVSWDIYKSYLTLGGGLYWAPFGVVNIDWLGGQTLFQLIPRASCAFPAHYNERGIRLNGSKELLNGFGANYVLSVGNGVHSYNIGGQRSFDADNGKTVMGRFGIFPGLGANLELGYSFAEGMLRDAGNDMLDPSNPIRYPASFAAHGADLNWRIADAKLRSYYIRSIERLDRIDAASPNPADIERQGFMAEASYHIWTNMSLGKIRALVPKFRFDWIDVDALTGDGMGVNEYQTAVYSFGLDLKSSGDVGAVLSLEYHFQDELKGQSAIDNNRFVARLLAKF